MTAAWSATATWSDTWALFGDALLAGGLFAAVLPWFGVLLLLRRQVFLAAAIGQSATFGIAAATATAGFCGLAEPGPLVVLAAAVGAAVATTAVALRGLSQAATGLEGRAVWVFLVAGSGALLLLADAPHGAQQVQRLLLSSVLGVAPRDIALAAVWLGGTALVLRLRWRTLGLWAMDPVVAAVHGVPVGRTDLVVGAWVGAGFAAAIAATGLTFTFGATVLPVLVLRQCARSLRAVLLLAPLVGVGGFLLGFWLGDRMDLPPGQVAVVVWGSAVLVGRLLAPAR